MSALTDLPNIGEDTARQLEEAGIDSPEKLREVGSEQAWLRLLARDPSACVQRMYGLEGAVRGIRKSELSEADKARLKAFVNQAKGKKQ